MASVISAGPKPKWLSVRSALTGFVIGAVVGGGIVALLRSRLLRGLLRRVAAGDLDG